MLDSVPQILTEIEAGDGIPLSRAAKLIPGTSGGHLDPSTLFRWTRTGARSTSGQRVILESIRCGGRILTSQAAVRRFMLALSNHTTDPTPAPRSPAARQRASAKAAAELERIGC